uniref:hypothetical protein n=1 Tax=Candidatus Fimenecus sp. TaxID=3022888 RepID=UPI00402863CF
MKNNAFCAYAGKYARRQKTDNKRSSRTLPCDRQSFWGNFVATGGGPVQAMPCSTAATILPTAAKTYRSDNRRIDFLNYEPLQKLAYVSYFCLHQAIAPIAMFVITQW